MLPQGAFDCRAISSTSQRAADVLAACWLVRSIAVPSASCGAHAVAASCRHGKAHSIAVRSAAAVGGQLMQIAAAVGGQQICRRPAGAARLAGWRVRF